MQNPGDISVMDPDETPSVDDLEHSFKRLSSATETEHGTESQGEPMSVGVSDRVAAFSSGAGSTAGGSGMSRSTPGKSSGIKGILKNRDMKSPVAPDALNYSGPVDGDNVRDNNYEEDEHRFSQLVDSRELFARKVRAGLVNKRYSYRSTSTESAPELAFYPKRKRENDEEGDEGDDDEGSDDSGHRSSASI